jgi:hypothetical protein
MTGVPEDTGNEPEVRTDSRISEPKLPIRRSSSGRAGVGHYFNGVSCHCLINSTVFRAPHQTTGNRHAMSEPDVAVES